MLSACLHNARLVASAVAVFLGVAATAQAQTFPPESAWVALTCGGGTVMTDAVQDHGGSFDERDIVGDANAPAGLRAADGQFLFLRMRLESDPEPGNTLRPFAWGWELDTDNVVSTYEVLILVDGVNGVVTLSRNTTTTLANDPNDPADTPAVATFPFATHGRVTSAAGSSFGGDGDFFLDIAVPWSALDGVGVRTSTPVVAWVASSSSNNSLNGDFACHNGAGGPPQLTAIPIDRVYLDPTRVPDGGVVIGGDGGVAGGRALEGGPGCNVAPGAARSEMAWCVWGLLALACLVRAATRKEGP
jgi:hypothetical protein